MWNKLLGFKKADKEKEEETKLSETLAGQRNTIINGRQEGGRFVKKRSKPSDSHYRLQAFLVSDACQKYK